MNVPLPAYPFDAQRCIGSVTEVGPAFAKVNLPEAASPEGQWLYGFRLGAGEVGEFVVIESRDLAVFGRITGVRLPERERLSVEPEIGARQQTHPLGTVQLLATIALQTGVVSSGIAQYPRLGSKVFSAHALLVKWMAETTQRTGELKEPLVIELASLPTASNTPVNVTPERVFGRHCAVLGATGGGKSWTVARLLEQIANARSKVILLDATGEFHTLRKGVRHASIGEGDLAPSDAVEVVLPYQQLTEADLFALFKPSGQTQAPKLRAAMKSLKLATIIGGPLVVDGLVPKAQRKRAPYELAYSTHASVIEGPFATFDVSRLPNQIFEECVWPTGRQDPTAWGLADDAAKSYCIQLITRIEDMLQAQELACLFKPGGKRTVTDVVTQFLEAPEDRILRLSLKNLSFSHNAREIVANAIGRWLLGLARQGRFREQPVLVVLDEAHQFLDKALGDENTRYPLDAFDLIAKEGRKFCLNICIATQRPRDIPEGVLSQMGTLIVHRLVNDKDREVVERASGEIDRSAAAFLPSLAPGQAVIIGVEFPIPLTVQIRPPDCQPDSRGPDYQTHWAPSTNVSNADAPLGAE